jgi:hypothetical protein
MDERLNKFWNELIEHCEMNKNFEFIFKVEYWGILWMPWFIYLDDKSLKFSANDISEEDLNELIRYNLIEFIEEIPLKDSIDLLTKKYKIKNHS